MRSSSSISALAMGGGQKALPRIAKNLRVFRAVGTGAFHAGRTREQRTKVCKPRLDAVSVSRARADSAADLLISNSGVEIYGKEYSFGYSDDGGYAPQRIEKLGREPLQLPAWIRLGDLRLRAEGLLRLQVKHA